MLACFKIKKKIYFKKKNEENLFFGKIGILLHHLKKNQETENFSQGKNNMISLSK